MAGTAQIVTGVGAPSRRVPLIVLADCPAASDGQSRDFRASVRTVLWTVAKRRPGLFVPPAFLPASGGTEQYPSTGVSLTQVTKWMAGDHDTAVVVPLTFRHHRDIVDIAADAIARAAHESGVRLISARGVDLDDPLLDLLPRLCNQAGIPQDHPVVLLAMWPKDPSWDQAARDLAASLSAGRPGPVSVEFSGPGRPNPRALSAFRRYSPIEKFYGVIPLALSSTREHLWTANATNGGARVTPAAQPRPDRHPPRPLRRGSSTRLPLTTRGRAHPVRRDTPAPNVVNKERLARVPSDEQSTGTWFERSPSGGIDTVHMTPHRPVTLTGTD